MCETGDREEEEVENVSVNLSGQQLINEVLEMFYCMNTQAHTHMLAIFVVLRVCACVCVSPAVMSILLQSFFVSLPIIWLTFSLARGRQEKHKEGEIEIVQ